MARGEQAGGAAVTLIQRAAGGFEPTIRRANTEKNNREWRDKAKPFLKSAAAVATLGTGASLGPEGPSVEIGTNCAALLFNSLRVPRRSKVPIIAAGSAAGLSAGFNAPIAGAFFAVEYVLQRSREKGEYGAPSTSSTTIAMVLLSAVLAAVVSQIGLGSEPAFKLPAYEQIRLVELPLFMLLGVLSGATSSAFLQGSKWFGKLFQRLEDSGIPRSFHPAIGGFCTGSIALWYPQVLYAGFTNVNAILDASSGPANYTWYLLLQIAAAKIVATCVCRSSGLVGGIYAPSLFLGAAVGCSYGSLALFGMSGGMHDFASFDSYAIVGMASMLAGICRVPLTSVLLMFELTRDYNILLPSLAAVGLSYWVASFSVPLQERNSEAGPSLAEEGEGAGADLGGMDAEVKELAGAALCRIDSEECSPEWGMEELAMRTMTCGSVAIRSLPVFDPGTGLVELGARMLEENADCAAVVERGTGAFLGLCTLDQKMAEIMEYSHLLDKASTCEDEFERMAWVAAFFVSPYAANERTYKPFNPILGETFEHYDANGLFYLAEQGLSAEAQSEKVRIEEKQRAERREREGNGDKWTPRWFEYDSDPQVYDGECDLDVVQPWIWNGSFEAEERSAHQGNGVESGGGAGVLGASFCPWQYNVD
eukprot:jgi/Pico_ML_1/53926/g4391.t1